MAPGIPSQVVPVSVVVLIYSSVCFTLSSMLVGLLVSFGESWSYVTLFSCFTALSTAASIAQQLHYAVSFIDIKQAQFDRAVLAQKEKGLAFGGAAHPIDQVLFFIQFYCYNVMALNILFWTVSLFTGSWGIRSRWLGSWYERVAPISKAFSILFPGLIIGLVNLQAVKDSGGLSIFVSYVAMFSSLSVGSVLLLLILYKYMKTRRLVAGYSRRGRWWASGSSKNRSENRSGNRSEPDVGTRYTAETAATASTRRSVYDRALLTRFTIGFIVLALFEVAIIVFTLFQSNGNASIAASGKPDRSSGSATSDILFFIPGVTASLVAFLVFGTTKNWRQYRDLIIGGCGIRKKLIIKKVQRAEEAERPQTLEFERLPSLHKTPTEEEREQGKEAVHRVKMFVKETVIRDDSSNEGGTSGSGGSGIRVDTERIVQFYPANADKTSISSPAPVRFKQESPGSVRSPRTTASQSSNRRESFPISLDAGLTFEAPPQNPGPRHHLRQISGPGEPRRFVMERLPSQAQAQPQHQRLQRDFIESDSGD